VNRAVAGSVPSTARQPADGLRLQPLEQVPLVTAGAFGQFRRGRRGVRQRAVQAQVDAQIRGAQLTGPDSCA
jgi:hypothetical protein